MQAILALQLAQDVSSSAVSLSVRRRWAHRGSGCACWAGAERAISMSCCLPMPGLHPGGRLDGVQLQPPDPLAGLGEHLVPVRMPPGDLVAHEDVSAWTAREQVQLLVDDGDAAARLGDRGEALRSPPTGSARSTRRREEAAQDVDEGGLARPFSPHRAWIWLSSREKDTASRARTPGKSGMSRLQDRAHLLASAVKEGALRPPRCTVFYLLGLGGSGPRDVLVDSS